MEYSNSQIREVIEEWIHNDRDRLILSLRLVDGKTFEQIAEHKGVDMSDRQVRRIVLKLQEQLFKHL